MTETAETEASSRSAVFEALIAQQLLARVTAHDLRTPLGSISGVVQLLRKQYGDVLPSKVGEYIDYLERGVFQMDGLIDAMTHPPVNVSDLCRPAPQDMVQAIECAIAAVRAPDMPPRITISGASWTVHADPDLLHLMLCHLLRNAAQHPHLDRPLEITVTLSVQDQTGHMCIRDTGTGFDPKTRHGIFLPSRTDSTLSRPARLGLATCKYICSRYGWNIEAQSDGHSGASFHVAFTVAR